MQNQLLKDDDCACFLVEAIAQRSQNVKWETTVDKNKVKMRILPSGSDKVADEFEVYFIRDTLTFNGRKGKTISIVPVFSDLVGVSATGVYYPLDNDTLLFGEGRGNSNIITDDLCTVSVKGGMGIIFINNGE